jgi:thioredoxin reductase (NADPH)
MFFARHASEVTLVVRGPDLERSMSHYLIQQVRESDRITVRTCTEVTECVGDGHLERIILRDTASGAEETIDCGHVFIFIGAAPFTDWLPDGVARDPAGFVMTGTDLLSSGKRPAGWSLDRDPFPLESSIPGIFVAGDVRAQSVKRVASAVGEGAMAVTLVHQYLATP